MASRPLASAIAVFVVAAVAAACGEDVDLGSGPAVDAAAREASAPDATASDAVSAPADDAAPCSTMSDAGPTCRSNGQYCRGPGDCCSARCDDSYCLPSGTCSPPGAACEYGASCCSGRCAPGPHGGTSCGAFCESNGAQCDDAQDCCSLGCNAGQCGGAICSVVGGPCVEDSGCCSGRCDSGRCAAAAQACLPSGEACSTDAGGGGGDAVRRCATARRAAATSAASTAGRRRAPASWTPIAAAASAWPIRRGSRCAPPRAWGPAAIATRTATAAAGHAAACRPLAANAPRARFPRSFVRGRPARSTG